MIKGQDTIVLETISLKETNGTLYFSPTVMNQNDQKPIQFELTDLSDSSFVFENEKHDFPQKIAYRMITKDSLVAEISGKQNGELKGSRFAMRRVQ